MLAHAGTLSGPDPNAWLMVQCPRHGAASLRFKGRCLSLDSTKCQSGQDLILALFERKTGGFTVAYSLYGHATWSQNAVICDSIEDAIETVEDESKRLAESQSRVFLESAHPTISDLASSLIAHSSFQNEVQAFLDLSGHALLRWQSLSNNAANAAMHKG